MPHIEHSPAAFQDQHGHRQAAILHITHYDARERLRRALLKLGLFWGLALASLPIIIAHWVLVPGFFLAGPWMAWRTYHVVQVRNHVTGACPACNAEVKVRLESDDVLPKWSYCPACNVPLQISAAD
jgi:hypothetical protein